MSEHNAAKEPDRGKIQLWVLNKDCGVMFKTNSPTAGWVKRMDHERVVAQYQATISSLIQPTSSLSPSEEVWAFAGWLTTRSESMTFGATEDAAQMADLVVEFLKSRRLQEPK